MVSVKPVATITNPTPSISESKVPWDPRELAGRTCSTCACYFESVNPQDSSKFQGFCRRVPADVHQLRAEVPRVDLAGKPVMKDGKPVMNSEVVTGYIYKVTQRDGTCFDGYRPKGTLPGEWPISAQAIAKAILNAPELRDVLDTFKTAAACPLPVEDQDQH